MSSLRPISVQSGRPSEHTCQTKCRRKDSDSDSQARAWGFGQEQCRDPHENAARAPIDQIPVHSSPNPWIAIDSGHEEILPQIGLD